MDAFSYKRRLKYLDDMISTWENLARNHPEVEGYGITLRDLKQHRNELNLRMLEELKRKKK